MAAKYSEYLALTLLNEGQTVTYRSLSRALKVHSNLAKQMLYDFHHIQISKKPASLHATYLLTGMRIVPLGAPQSNGVRAEDGEDSHMRSSPLPASSAPQTQENGAQESTSIKVVTLVKEEQLGEAKASFDEILSIHIYSLELGAIKDLETLTECNQRVIVESMREDPLESWKQYGIIQNSNVTRRTARRPPPAVAPPAPSVKLVKQESAPKPLSTKASNTNSPTVSEPVSSKTTPEPDQTIVPPARNTAASKPSGVKREVSSIFKSFAKAKAKPPKPVIEDTSQPSQVENPTDDDAMGGLSDEEAGDDDPAMLDEGAVDGPKGKTKREREEELRQMMEADDEPMEDAPIEASESVAASGDDNSQTIEEATPTETVTVSDGRRRGRRRVMKKKTVKDEEGYLVTKEEAAWESFSEDEPAPKKPKISAPVPAATKSKKASGKPGQGNIMSFFKKA